ncbi:TetR/AcrR family transcriptional regulator [Actinoplanes solisilvae]|uniref:TetR/AcrR family transcriptional regulator n=1 Tax=Actinoplanes solisilvae TaxID=2486853 RepID=UPI000FDA058B|nr:TetR/AcrR family transcriptional regulator [Actinoplanes solisilvae]
MERLTRVQAQELTHERLLAAGRVVFLRRGFLAATLEEVAAEAGYTRGAVYKHFGGKDGLWDALVRTQIEAVLGALRHALGEATSRDDVLAVLNPSVAISDPDVTRWAVVSAEALAAGAGKNEQARFDGELTAALAECCERLGLRPAMPVPHLVAAWGALGGGLMLRHARDDSEDVATIAAGALAALMREA